MTSRYTISIAVYNNIELTKKCIESVVKYSEDFELIVVDNGSTDGTADYLCSLNGDFPFAVIRHYKNQGFLIAHKEALEYARGCYFVILNNDVMVCDKWLKIMVEQFYLNPKLAICGVRGMCSKVGDDGIGYTSDEVEYVEASCMMIPVHIARKFGLFSSAFRFAYCEDCDLSLRLRQAGYAITVVDMPIQHERAMTSKLVQKEIDLNGYRVLNQHLIKARWARYLNKRDFRYKIAIKRAAAMGDVLLLTPVIRAIKQKYGEAEITVITEQADILAGNPDVHKICASCDGAEKYDEIHDLDMVYERCPNKHIIDAYAEACGVKITDYRLKIHIPKNVRKEIEKILPKRKYAVIHPSQFNWPGRNWPIDRFVPVIIYLKDNGLSTVLLGDRSTPNLPCDIDLRGKTSIAELAAVIERASVFVGIDSLPMHLAQAAMITTVAVFGCIDPKKRLLNIPYFIGVVNESVGCVGCHHYRSWPRIYSDCLREKPYCMEGITSEMVIDAVKKAMDIHKCYLETSKIRDKIIGRLKGKVIDIGCGRDKITEEAIGFDKEDWPEVDIQGDASVRMPFSDGEFDTVYSSHCLEDIADTKMALAEWLRILKKGGLIILHLPHKDYYKGVNLDHKHNFVPEDIESLLKELNCKVIERIMDVEDECHYSFIVIAEK